MKKLALVAFYCGVAAATFGSMKPMASTSKNFNSPDSARTDSGKRRHHRCPVWEPKFFCDSLRHHHK